MVAPIIFLQRPYPSANAMVLTGPRPVLIDPGFGADVAALEALCNGVGLRPSDMALAINTHFDCNHAGANHALATRYNVPIAASGIDAALINTRHDDACRARWLHQPIEPYCVNVTLEDGDTIDTGAGSWRVILTPGHTAGHLSLYSAESRILICGDAVHSDDVGWIDPRQPNVLNEADETISHLASLLIDIAYSGHGAPTLEPALAFAAARRRLAGWRHAPERMAWHGVKRVFAYALMVENGLHDTQLLPYLLSCPWFHDYAAAPFGLSPDAFAPVVVAEMLRAGAARWVGALLIPGAAFVPPTSGWATAPTLVDKWPR